MENIIECIEKLRAENRKLVDGNLFAEGSPTVKKYKENEEKIKKLRIQKRLLEVNTEQKKLRELAVSVWNIEKNVTPDLVCSDGTTHNTKVKKFPKLAALKYCRLKFKGSLLDQVIIGREMFNFNEYRDGEYLPVQTFEDFLNNNNITLNDIKLSTYLKLIKENEKINAEFDKATRKFSEQKDRLKLYFYANIKLMAQDSRPDYVYKFDVNI